MFIGIFWRVRDHGNSAPVSPFKEQQQPGRINCPIILVMVEPTRVKPGVVNRMDPAYIDFDRRE